MIASMTGFGRGRAERNGVSVTVELKSVNSRFCEISVRGPRSLAEKELDLQNRIKESVARGRISAHVTVEQDPGQPFPAFVNLAAAETYRDLLQDLTRGLGIQDPVRLDHLLRFPEVLEKGDAAEPEVEVVWPVVSEALGTALEGLCAMRKREGEALAADLTSRLDSIEDDLGAVNERAPERITAARSRLHERIGEVLGDERVDRDRLEFEIALLADKLDVNEEAVRLESHIRLFREALASGEPVGRKLNFIAQEINREINTIGSKANDSSLAHVVVRMKEHLEKIREQVENVE